MRHVLDDTQRGRRHGRRRCRSAYTLAFASAKRMQKARRWRDRKRAPLGRRPPRAGCALSRCTEDVAMRAPVVRVRA